MVSNRKLKNMEKIHLFPLITTIDEVHTFLRLNETLTLRSFDYCFKETLDAIGIHNFLKMAVWNAINNNHDKANTDPIFRTI